MPVRNVVFAGTTIVCLNVPVASVRTNVWSGSCATVNGVCVAGTRPATVAVRVPVYPTPTFQLTGAPFENTSVAVANGVGRATTGIRTLCVPSDQVR